MIYSELDREEATGGSLQPLQSNLLPLKVGLNPTLGENPKLKSSTSPHPPRNQVRIPQLTNLCFSVEPDLADWQFPISRSKDSQSQLLWAFGVRHWLRFERLDFLLFLTHISHHDKTKDGPQKDRPRNDNRPYPTSQSRRLRQPGLQTGNYGTAYGLHERSSGSS